MYKLSYYRSWDAGLQPRGMDRVRHTTIGHTDYKLNYFEEAYTTNLWIVRIFKKKPVHPRVKVRMAVAEGKTKEAKEERLPEEMLRGYKYRRQN
jgi:hypothetical protein